jgi:hypothetical protein
MSRCFRLDPECFIIALKPELERPMASSGPSGLLLSMSRVVLKSTNDNGGLLQSVKSLVNPASVAVSFSETRSLKRRRHWLCMVSKTASSASRNFSRERVRKLLPRCSIRCMSASADTSRPICSDRCSSCDIVAMALTADSPMRRHNSSFRRLRFGQ